MNLLKCQTRGKRSRTNLIKVSEDMSYCLFLAPRETCPLTASPLEVSAVEHVHIILAEISHFQEFITLVLRQTNGMHSPYFKESFQNFNAEKFSIGLLANSNKLIISEEWWLLCSLRYIIQSGRGKKALDFETFSVPFRSESASPIVQDH